MGGHSEIQPPRPSRIRAGRSPDALPRPDRRRRAGARSRTSSPPPTTPPSILATEVRPIDLATTLRLANVQNPELNVARQRILEAAALRQLAAAYFLPSINPGMNYDSHTGVLQQSNGNILSAEPIGGVRGGGGQRRRLGDGGDPGRLLCRQRRRGDLRLPGHRSRSCGSASSRRSRSATRCCSRWPRPTASCCGPRAGGRRGSRRATRRG